jgi:two-component system, OmpR family, sensor histidine kinase MprB
VSFRRRVVLLVAGAVAGAIVLSAVTVCVVTRNKLIDQLDNSLRQKPASVVFVAVPNGRGVRVTRRVAGGLPPALGFGTISGGGAVNHSESVTTQAHPGPRKPTETVTVERKTIVLPRGTLSGQRKVGLGPEFALPTQALGGAIGYVQLHTSSGQLVHSEGYGVQLPVTATTRAVAAGRRKPFFSNVTIDGTRERMFTEAAGQGGVWQAALPLADLESTLSRLRLVLALVCLGGIALAGALALIVARAALAPVRRLTGAAEEVAQTQDLGHRIQARGEDELGRLASSFNTMLRALANSRLAQRQLVSDASHELRTPLTSIRTNLDALADGERLTQSERARVVAAVQVQLAELTVLVGDLVDLSKTEVDELEVEDVRLDLAAAAAVERARLHAPACGFQLEAEPCLVRAAPGRLDRAIANLLDNACQWNPPSAPPIEVSVACGVLRVRDHGPGIAEQDLPRVFDRFFRSPAARGRPGSGLGLAIVRQVAEYHGGVVRAGNDPRGGACLALELPVVPMSEDELRGCDTRDPAEPPVHGSPRSP